MPGEEDGGVIDVLVVDDEDGIREAIAIYLRRRGCTVREAADGLEALAALKKERFRLVVSDLLMPRMGGVELIPEIKRKWPDLPVLVLSAYLDLQNCMEAVRSGADGFCPKPVDFAKLSEAMDRIRNRAPGEKGLPFV